MSNITARPGYRDGSFFTLEAAVIRIAMIALTLCLTCCAQRRDYQMSDGISVHDGAAMASVLKRTRATSDTE